MKKRVVIGLSGGLDSAMAALMLKKKGYNVIGLHFSFSDEKYSTEVNGIADKLEIPLFTENIKNEFEIVKQYFANEYLKGRTPSPCTFCNRVVKWNKLLQFADSNNCDLIASGHYIRKENIKGKYYFKKGVDPIKDQSYFLWELNSDIIERIITPLGDYTKEQIREFAKLNGFNHLASKKESMGVCFLHKMDYRDFLKKYIPDEIRKIKPGVVVNEENQPIGTHNGYIYYTIGQKRDLLLNDNRKAYVGSVDSINNVLKVGSKQSLNHFNIKLAQIHLIDKDDVKPGSEITVNVRGYGLNPKELAIVKEINSQEIIVSLKSAAWAVAPGQPVVFYKDDLLLGGSIAEKSW